MKKVFLRILTLAAALASGTTLAASGDIWQILPCDEIGTTLTGPIASADNPIALPGSNLYFKVRLIRRNGDDGTCWHLRNTVTPGVDDYLNPLRICIYVSGRKTYANYVGEIESAENTNGGTYGDKYFTDVIFNYKVKPGDFALPIKLGTATGPADDVRVEDVSYYFDPLTSWRWEFFCKDADEEKTDVCMWFEGENVATIRTARSMPDLAFPSKDPAGRDYSLKDCGFYVKTIGFDEDWEESGTLWRTVHQNSRTIKVGSTPSLISLVSTLTPTNSEDLTTLYVWSDNEEAVVITNKPGSGTVSVRAVKMRISSLKTDTRTYQVAAVTFPANSTKSEFEIWGVKEGGTANLILSAYDHFNYSSASNVREIDYVTVPVKCGEELPPSVKVTPGKTRLVATKDYDYYQTELDVSFTQSLSYDVTFTVTPSLEAYPDTDWKDYLAIYDSPELDGTPPSAATNVTYTIPAGSTVPMEDGVQKRIYLFALRSDAKVTGTKHIVFTPATENASALGDLKGWGTPTASITIDADEPVIDEPEEGDDSLTAVAGADRTLRIKVSDTYADMNVVSNGYQIFIIKDKDTESEFVPVGGETARYVIGTGGYLYLTNALGTASTTLPTVKYSVTDHANKSIIKVKSPISTLESEDRNFTVTVTAPANVTIDTVDGTLDFTEGDTVSLVVTLSKQNATGGSLYAFLKPVGSGDEYTKNLNAVDCSFLAATGNSGLEIGQYGTTVSGFITLLDGCSTAATSQFSYQVELRTARAYGEGELVASYLCKNTLILKSTNVIPTVDSVSMGLEDTQYDETSKKWTFPDVVVAKGVVQTFTANVTEPGTADLTAAGETASVDRKFKTRWKFSTTGVSAKGPANGDSSGVVEGNPAENPAEFTFTKAGTWKVVVDLEDKDMSTFGSGELKKSFTFYVEVVDQPAMSLSYGTSGYESQYLAETECLDEGGEAYVRLALTFNKCDFDLKVGLTISHEEDPKGGLLVLQTSTYVQTGAEAGWGDYDYVVTFPEGVTEQEIPIRTLDGTRVSRSYGFTITPKMLTQSVVPESGGKYASEYYIADAANKPLKVYNVDPWVNAGEIQPVPGTNVIATTIGTLNEISWRFDDVEHDFSEQGISVKVTGGTTSYEKTIKTRDEAEDSHTVSFNASGQHTVTLKIQDKDGQSQTFSWVYDVAPSKTLQAIPHGPTAGLAGLYTGVCGEGRVFASGSAGVSEFTHTFNCGLNSTWRVYGYGYKVGDAEGEAMHYPYTRLYGERTGYNGTRDTLIDKDGNFNAAGGYRYEHASGKNVDDNGMPVDSFLYAWLVKSTESSGNASASWSVLAYKPETPEVVDAGTEVPLPTESDDEGDYAQTVVEAVFSLEYLASDNMGDINQDGIPDAWFHKSSFGFVSSDSSSSDTETADDSPSKRAYNDDEDYLPAFLANSAGYILDYTDKTPFTMFLELRGYGEALNDAPSKNSYVRLTGYRPDRCYLDPEIYGPTSTLTKVEYLAWCEFAKAKGLSAENPAAWEEWSPENPTDPTVDDTDGDGMDDGFEYAFWYRAHVGFYNSATGEHTYLTGRRFSVSNPGSGTPITREYIENTFNPTVPFDASTVTLDSDNDGLPDLLEFELGTNPVDFDSDGDGLPDGWELTVSMTDPLLSATDGSTLDSLRNTDGDAMAYTDTTLEKAVQPTPTFIQKWCTFATVDPAGDTSGVQWYAARHADYAANFELSVVEDDGDETEPKPLKAWHFSVGDVDYLTVDPAFAYTDAGRLANTLDEAHTWTAAAKDDDDVAAAGITLETAEWIRLMPARLEAGVEIIPDAEETTYAVLTFSAVPEANAHASHAAWVYGSAGAVLDSGEKDTVTCAYGKLALARYAAPQAEVPLAALPLETRDVALMHHLVYQEYGFDPRTAWKASSPLSERFGEYEDVTGDGVGGYAGIATRTRKYTNYDEFLVMSFFYNTTGKLFANGNEDGLIAVFLANTTNPRGPGEKSAKDIEIDEDSDSDDSDDSDESSRLVDAERKDCGADTDDDGVPDGWELYVMSGMKSKEGVFQFAPAYRSWTRPVFDGKVEIDTEIPESYFSPFVASAQESDTDNKLYVGKNETDSLTEYQEFAGTDSCAYYSDVPEGAETGYSTTIVRPEEHKKWLNKFFPSDPWLADTDDDGVKDSEEFGAFVYGEPEDDGTSKFLPGAGLNPCTVDTDMDGLPDGWEKQYAGTWDSENGIQDKDHGIVNGMDGTVQDARTMDTASVNRDYDHDGLDNWQEYMTHAMRCWRYDDAYSSWTSIPFERYYQMYPGLDSAGFFAPDFDALGIAEDECVTNRMAEFWYKTLVDQTSPIYNPHLIYDQASGAQYLTRVDKGWDLNYVDKSLSDSTIPGGVYYYFAHRVGNRKYSEKWTEVEGRADWASSTPPVQYVGCSPLVADTDQDGMDDYYELFHGLNPLLGESGSTMRMPYPCDVVSSIAGISKMPIYATSADVWWFKEGNWPGPKRGNNPYLDYTLFPWLAGEQDADPDGDDVRNSVESIMPMLSTTTWLHTDPTPAWMTDTSYSNSLVRLHYRVPRRMLNVTLNGVDRSGTQVSSMKVEDENGDLVPGFTYDGTNYYFRDFDGFVDEDTSSMPAAPAYFSSFFFDRFQWVPGADEVFHVGSSCVDARTGNNVYVGDYMFSFEENEGYDTDHDGVGDAEEVKGEFADSSDPQLAESPLRRQAMYFPGENAVLQTMPKVVEEHAAMGDEFPANLTFQQFTVECWARPERTDDAILVERTVWATGSQAGDEDLIRKNFQIAIKSGRWYAKYDTSGTLAGADVSVMGDTDVEAGAWTHVAATYDGKRLRLYVNGVLAGMLAQDTASTQQPEYGLSAFAVYGGGLGRSRYGSYSAILVGAGLKTYADFPDVAFLAQDVGLALDLASQVSGCKDSAAFWSKHYKGFFKGWIDEVRIWDGARTAAEVKAAMSKRMKAEDIEELRTDFYSEWGDAGKRRYEKDSSGNDYEIEAELVHHYTFDSLFAAENAEALVVAPRAFEDGSKSTYARPEGYRINWWAGVLAKYGSLYAGAANYVPWIADTVAHLPRYDGTTVDSAYWSEDFEGATGGTYKFARTAEPYSLWHQHYHNAPAGEYATLALRYHMASQTNTSTRFDRLYEFTGRHACSSGCDLLPLGGAYARYVDVMWDEQGAGSMHDLTGGDSDSDGIPDWWEAYADENYRLEPSEPITWTTLLNYRGTIVTAGEAYQRDLARGFYLKSDGSVEKGPTVYAQTADADSNGIPDWWEKLYRISGETALADHDNDGLVNFTEYLLSEVFDLGVTFSPVKANSANRHYTDYFFPIGKLYAGAIFTDHDFVDDDWEDVYADTYSSRLVYDAFRDADEDGWCNRSENRYAKQCLPTMADQQSHFTAADGQVADYPIPTIALTIRYNGERRDEVVAAPYTIVVSSKSDTEAVSAPDATFTIEGLTDDEKKSGSGASSDFEATSTQTAYTRILGKWSNRHAIGTLTPGNIAINSLDLQFCADASSVIYSWQVLVDELNQTWETKRGTRVEYDTDRRKYGDTNIMLLSTQSSYQSLEGMELRTAENSTVATWIHTRSGLTLGTVNLATGAFDLDLGVFAGYYAVDPTNGEAQVSLEDQTYRIAYAANKSTDLPRHFYLGQASSGHVREGKNTIVVWADTGSEAGVWEPGEPYGIVRDVDISWKGTSAEIELTAQTPVTQRINLWTDEGDRGETYSTTLERIQSDIISKHYAESVEKMLLEDFEAWKTGNPVAGESAVKELMSETEPVRMRVVRWLVNNTPVYSMAMPARVVLDKKFDPFARRNMTERDFLSSSQLDLDWEYLKSEVIDSVYASDAEITSVSYLVVVGDGEISWSSRNDTNIVVKALDSVITRRFGSARVKAAPLSPSSTESGVVTTPNPTFRWRLDCPELEGYTAFRIVVTSTAGNTVWDSGVKPAPTKDADGVYSYAAPLYVGDLTPQGAVFANKARYSWKVAMYNAKYKDDQGAYGNAEPFYMNVQTNGLASGSARVAVKYFGPRETYSKKSSTIRVRAYASPDFTGTPSAAGYVADPDNGTNGVGVTTSEPLENACVIGLSKGSYYIQAYIDSNDNGVCDVWETQGYYCRRDGTTSDWLDPTAVTFDTEVGSGDLVPIYLEDSDTDGDGLPDAWEYAMYGSLTAKGVELLSQTAAGECVLNTNLVRSLTLQSGSLVPTAGLAAHALSSMQNAGTLSLTLGVETDADESFSAAISGSVSPELAENGVSIKNLSLENGKISIEVEAETTPSRLATNPFASALVLSQPTVTVQCYVSVAADLASGWTELDPVEITVGGEAATVDVSKLIEDAGLTAKPQFFKVRLEK